MVQSTPQTFASLPLPDIRNDPAWGKGKAAAGNRWPLSLSSPSSHPRPLKRGIIWKLGLQGHTTQLLLQSHTKTHCKAHHATTSGWRRWGRESTHCCVYFCSCTRWEVRCAFKSHYDLYYLSEHLIETSWTCHEINLPALQRQRCNKAEGRQGDQKVSWSTGTLACSSWVTKLCSCTICRSKQKMQEWTPARPMKCVLSIYQSDPKWACLCVKDALSLRSAAIPCECLVFRFPRGLCGRSFVDTFGRFPLANKKDEHHAEIHGKLHGAQGDPLRRILPEHCHSDEGARECPLTTGERRERRSCKTLVTFSQDLRCLIESHSYNQWPPDGSFQSYEPWTEES